MAARYFKYKGILNIKKENRKAFYKSCDDYEKDI